MGTIEIITPRDLDEINQEVIIVDARPFGFFFGHISGSIYLDWKDWTEERPSFYNAIFGDPAKWGKTKCDESVENQLCKIGLSRSKMIVIVGSGKGFGEEGRVAWNLLFWGAEKIALLDGGFTAWKSLGYKPELGFSSTKKRGHFKISVVDERRANQKNILNIIESKAQRIFDVRTLKEFHGRLMPGQKRGGCLPGAILVPFKELYQRDGSFVTASKLRQLVGGDISSRPITYCTGGVRSALLAILLEARLGIPASNYDGSLWEWSQDSKLPMNLSRE